MRDNINIYFKIEKRSESYCGVHERYNVETGVIEILHYEVILPPGSELGEAIKFVSTELRNVGTFWYNFNSN